MARAAGLDGERFDRALAEHRHVDAALALTRESHERGHAAGELWVNGRRSSVWTSEEGLAATLDEARHRAEALLEAGVPLSRVYDELTAEEPLPVEAARGRRRLQPDLDGAPSRGPALAPVTIVVFSNLACVGCGELSSTVRRLREAHPGELREVWRDFVPGYASPGSIDESAAELAVAAALQGRFWPLHDAAALAQGAGVRRGRAELEAIARTAGVDLARAERDARAGLLRTAVTREKEEARRLGVPFAPSLLLDGILFTGVTSFDKLDRAVRAELERGVADRLGGP